MITGWSMGCERMTLPHRESTGPARSAERSLDGFHRDHNARMSSSPKRISDWRWLWNNSPLLFVLNSIACHVTQCSNRIAVHRATLLLSSRTREWLPCGSCHTSRVLRSFLQLQLLLSLAVCEGREPQGLDPRGFLTVKANNGK